MVQLTPTTVRRDSAALVAPLHALAAGCAELSAATVGTFDSDERAYRIERFIFKGPKAEHDPIRLGLFGGIHGDEPASAEALVRFLEEAVRDPQRVKGYDLVVYPVCNPTGFEDNTRHNRAGLDLNREFWRGSAQPEIHALEAELRAWHFDGIITLHADDTSDGLYGYAHGRVLNEALLKPALRASAGILPLNLAALIDGFEASEAVLHRCFEGVLAAPCDQRPQPFDLIFETPALAPNDLQVRAAVAALGAILDEYRGFIAHAQYL